jgi:hypothetical protein
MFAVAVVFVRPAAAARYHKDSSEFFKIKFLFSSQITSIAVLK